VSKLILTTLNLSRFVRLFSLIGIVWTLCVSLILHIFQLNSSIGQRKATINLFFLFKAGQCVCNWCWLMLIFFFSSVFFIQFISVESSIDGIDWKSFFFSIRVCFFSAINDRRIVLGKIFRPKVDRDSKFKYRCTRKIFN
jgi:hypothetical protein